MIELKKKPVTAQSRTTFLPQISENLAQIGEEAVLPKRYAPLIQAYPFAEFSSLHIVGIDVPIMVAFKAEMKRAEKRAISEVIRLNRLRGVGFSDIDLAAGANGVSGRTVWIEGGAGIITSSWSFS